MKDGREKESFFYSRRMVDLMERDNIPILAICYDFDKTLTPTDMQAQGYIQSVGYDVAQFWEETGRLARANGMDSNLAYMLKMVQEAEGNLVLTKEALRTYGSKVRLFPGVETWFSRIRSFGLEHGVKVEHYIISSGLKEMIEGTPISSEFERIYASAFYYNSRGVAKWPAQAVNYTNKTQFLFRIEKGALDVNDDAVNNYFPEDELRVPFRNMVYIGDSDTDIPCMKLVTVNGGHAIGVYQDAESLEKVRKMQREHRVRYIAEGDYRENSALDRLMKQIILTTQQREQLRKYQSTECHVDG